MRATVARCLRYWKASVNRPGSRSAPVSTTWVHHRPEGWREHAYVVIRKLYEGDQRRLVPAYTVILVSRDDLPLVKLVRHHRGKKGQRAPSRAC